MRACNPIRSSLAVKTFLLWGYMWQNISDCANPLYREKVGMSYYGLTREFKLSCKTCIRLDC